MSKYLTFQIGALLYYVALLFQFTGPGLSCTYPGCGAVLKSRWGYQQHMKRHVGIHQYYCPYCNKGLSGTKDIKRHLKSQHTGLFGFHCVRCRVEFETIHLLKAHLNQKSCTEGLTLHT